MLHRPAGTLRGGAVVCHPHPQYGGDMDNPVVTTAVRAACDAGYAALRFNFGGVGDSEGSFDGGTAETADALCALDRPEIVPPRVLLGYSFGAWVAAHAAGSRPALERVVLIAPPLDLLTLPDLTRLGPAVTILVGDRDGYCASSRADALAVPERVTVDVLRGADHFFGMHLAVLDGALRRALGAPTKG